MSLIYSVTSEDHCVESRNWEFDLYLALTFQNADWNSEYPDMLKQILRFSYVECLTLYDVGVDGRSLLDILGYPYRFRNLKRLEFEAVDFLGSWEPITKLYNYYSELNIEMYECDTNKHFETIEEQYFTGLANLIDYVGF